MKISSLFPKQKKLRTTARAVPRRDEYDEPSMKLSSAFVVVLLLHVVAVGGIYAFNSINANKSRSEPPPVAPVKSEHDEAKPALSSATNPGDAKTHSAKPAVSAPETHANADVKKSSEFYTVAKGDNPVAIARKLHVNYAELLKLNKIDDPKKLQIGQMLKLPPKTKSN